MRAFFRADKARVEEDEDGFTLHVDTEDGDEFIFRINDTAEELMLSTSATIGLWVADRDRAHASIPGPPVDLEAYPPGDPKRIALEQEIG